MSRSLSWEGNTVYSTLRHATHPNVTRINPALACRRRFATHQRFCPGAVNDGSAVRYHLRTFQICYIVTTRKARDGGSLETPRRDRYRAVCASGGFSSLLFLISPSHRLPVSLAARTFCRWESLFRAVYFAGKHVSTLSRARISGHGKLYLCSLTSPTPFPFSPNTTSSFLTSPHTPPA